MLFNSLQFAVFFPVVTLLYYLLPYRNRWSMLLVASCVFYMAFIPAYIVVLFATILIDYCAALWMERCSGSRKRWLLMLSIVSTCLVLFVFKYFNFFNTNLQALAGALHWNYSVAALKIILPIGLSFHTFQSLSYVIEVYRGRQKAERHFGIYALYVMFYPQLVAGPIERPQNLLHQLREGHRFDYDGFTAGLKLMVWGLFKKAVIADRLAICVNGVYADPSKFAGEQLAVATVAFAFQIYCDFSGYSDIAIGAARVMGITLMKNFDRPYFSKSIGEFWQRWHISLSTWFRDYLYIPLGGNRVSRPRWYLNVMATFLVSGLWHGANWTYVLWGALNGFYLICGAVTARLRRRLYSLLHIRESSLPVRILRVGFTFGLTCFAWIFFRSNSVQNAAYVILHCWRVSANPLASVYGFDRRDLAIAGVALAVLLGVHLLQRTRSVIASLARLPIYIRWPIYYAFVFFVLDFGVYDRMQFIYFQF